MVKIKKIVLYGIVALILVQIACAVEVGLVVDFPDGSKVRECVYVPDGANAKDVLEASILSVQYIWGGGFIDVINGVASDHVNFLYWSFWQSNVDHFEFSPVGVEEAIMPKEGTIIGFAYGGWGGMEPDNKPTFIPYEEVCRMVKITDLKAYVDDDEASADEDGGRIRDAKPGSEIKLEIKVSNLYTRSEDIDIDDVSVTVTIEDLDNGDDLDDESDEVDIGAGKEKDIEITFRVPLGVEDDTYDMTLKLEGYDDLGWEYEETIEFEFEVEKEDNELRILDAEISPNRIRCDRSLRLDLRMINTGTHDEDVKLKIENEQLGLNIEDSFTLSEDPDDDNNDYEKEHYIKIDEDVAAGSYSIFISAEYGDKKVSEIINLNIEDCGTSIVELRYQNLPTGQASTPQSSQTNQAIIQEPKPMKVNKTLMIILMVNIVIIVTGVIVFLVVKTNVSTLE